MPACFERLILLGERSLRRALREYSANYLRQGVNHQLLEPSNVIALSTGSVQRRERLGEMLSF